MEWKSATTKENGAISVPESWLFLHYYEALNILFRMENSLRVFVYVVLKNKFKEKWTDTSLQTAEDQQTTIAATALRRMAQAKGFGYLGYEISSPLMYLNSGELTQIICAESYWNLFKPFFRGKKEIMRNKLDEIGTVRNSLAHFRPLKYDDIELIKQNVKHVFVGIEQCFQEMTVTHRVIPTNTEGAWYKNLTTLGSTHCTLQLFQSSSEEWVRVNVTYTCAILRQTGSGDYRTFYVTNLISPAVIKCFPALARHCTFVTERIPHTTMPKDGAPKFEKGISFVFRRDALVENHVEICGAIKDVFLKVEMETELIQNDNLARGQLIDSVQIWYYVEKTTGDHKSWSNNIDELKCGFGEDDPSEYWGAIDVYGSDFIAASVRYPWMPSDISKEEIPF